MRLFITSMIFAFSVGLFAQAGNAPSADSDFKAPEKLENSEATKKRYEDSQQSKSNNSTEVILDGKIRDFNERLKAHSVLFRMKIKALPAKTILHKGKPNAEKTKCIIAEKDETSDENTCLKLEVFDFQDSEWGKSELNHGSRAKYIELFFKGGSVGTERDPMKQPPRELEKVTFNTVERDFVQNEVKFSNIEDGKPHTDPTPVSAYKGSAHDETYVLFYQHGYPVLDMSKFPNTDAQLTEATNERGVGKYQLSYMENTRTRPNRVQYKKQFIVKNLDFFDKLFKAIADTNERYSQKKYNANREFLKGSLKY